MLPAVSVPRCATNVHAAALLRAKAIGCISAKPFARSLATGGEPLRLLRKRRPDRTRKIVALCDVSGSMSVYAQVFLAFLAGLMRADTAADAYLFHTRLVRITEALRDKDAMRAIGRLSLMADGFGGGSKIGPSLMRFADTYAKRFVDGRSVVLILSDGYDTEPPAMIAAALEKLRKRGLQSNLAEPFERLGGLCAHSRGNGRRASVSGHL